MLVKRLGLGTIMAMLDLHSAYRKVPVHPDDQHLLSLEWQGVVYTDKALPFGLRLAPKLFTAVADGLAWALECRGLITFFTTLMTSSSAVHLLLSPVPGPWRRQFLLVRSLGSQFLLQNWKAHPPPSPSWALRLIHCIRS